MFLRGLLIFWAGAALAVAGCRPTVGSLFDPIAVGEVDAGTDAVPSGQTIPLPEALAPHEAWPGALYIDASYIYWTDAAHHIDRGPYGSVIRRMAKAGGAADDFISSTTTTWNATHLVAVGNQFFFNDTMGWNRNNPYSTVSQQNSWANLPHLLSVDQSQGATPQAIQRQLYSVSAVAADDQNVYWATSGDTYALPSDFGLRMQPRAGGAATLLDGSPVVDVIHTARGLFWIVSHAHWIDHAIGDSCAVRWLPPGATKFTELFQETNCYPRWIVADETSVYMNDQFSNVITAIPIDGGPVVPFQVGTHVGRMFVDGCGIYAFADFAAAVKDPTSVSQYPTFQNSTLVRISKDGRSVVKLADKISGGGDLVADDQFVYFTTYQGGVYRLPK